MDNNRFIGFTLIMLLILTYYTFFPPGQIPESEDINQTPNTEVLDEVQINPKTDENKYKKNENFLSSAVEEKFEVDNDLIRVTFSNKGAKIVDVKLKEYSTKNSQEVHLYDSKRGDINFILNDNENINFNEIVFDKNIKSDSEKKTIRFSALGVDNKKITVIYEIGDSYIINSRVLLNDEFNGLKNIKFQWENNLIHQEENIVNEKNQTRINFYSLDESFDYTSATSKDDEEIKIEDPLKWVSFKQQFFSSAVISDNNIINSTVLSKYVESDEINKNFSVSSDIPIINNSISLKFYFGPNKYSILKEIESEFHNNIYLGWIGVGGFNRYVIVPIFNFLEKITSNYGLIILFMVVLIRIVVTPLTYKSHLSMAKMKVLNPEIQEIRKKHDGDMQKSQAEIMELYTKTGVSPLGGCLPILFQLPILVSVFYFLPNAIELRGKSFLWASDLSNYDSILDLPFYLPLYGDHISLFTILMTVSTILINKANSQMQTMEGPMKTIQYVLPIMFLFIFNNFSAGLTYYYFLSNVASYAQINIFKMFVDEEKIKKEIDFNRKRNLNSNKSSFQLRLEEAMKARQEKKKKNR